MIRVRKALFLSGALLGFLVGSVRADVPPASFHARKSPLIWETRGEFAAYQDTDAVTVFTPAVSAKVRDPLANWSAAGSYLVDVVSAASVDIVSTASPSWQEIRHAASLEASYKPGTYGAAIAGSVSSEPDYLSLGAGVRGTAELARKSATLQLGAMYARDVAGRKDTPFSVYALELDRYATSASVELVLDRATTLTPSFDFTYESGRQEKPYRYLPLFSGDVVARVEPGASPARVNQLRLPGRVAEHVPDERARYALAGRLAHRFRYSTLLIFSRVYADGWGLFASTTDARFVIELGERWSLWPHGRAHVQSGVSFWRRGYVGRADGTVLEVPTWRTGDRELGPLWSGTLGPGLRWDFGGSDPRAFSALLELEATYTHYPDTLYIEQRWAGFGSLQVEARFR
ncbi:MAG TPA: DUF3570 domain-containing protein [Polyangiaceae bacterium]